MRRGKRAISKREKQLGFEIDGFGKPGDCFGGSLLKNSHAKTKRPLDSKLPLHLVLRSDWARMRTPRAFGVVNRIVQESARKYGVTIYKFANVGNHLHLLIRVKSQRLWAAFIRELTGRIAQGLQGPRIRSPGLQGPRIRSPGLQGPRIRSPGLQGPRRRKFWSQRPFTRIVRGWRQPFRALKEYIGLNILEAEGFISRSETKSLKELRLVFADS